MNKVILIDNEPWTKRRKELFFFLYENSKIEFEVFDLSELLFPGLTFSDLLDEKYVHRIKTIEELKILLGKEDPKSTLLQIEIPEGWKSRKILKLISELKFEKFKIQLFGNGEILSFWKKIFSFNLIELVKYTFKRFPDFSLFQIYSKINKISGYRFYFNSRKMNIEGFYPINHPDYENFRFEDHLPIISGEYIVFLDNYFPYHPDIKKYYYADVISCGESYKKSLIRFFDFLEKKYQMPVIIAAHPKAEYGENHFDGRKILKYHTDNLVINSKAIIAHSSNSISYAVLGNKPLLLFGTDDYFRVYRFKRSVKNLSRLLKIPYYNIDSMNLEDFEFSKLDKQVRESYIYSFLTSSHLENQRNNETISHIIAEYKK